MSLATPPVFKTGPMAIPVTHPRRNVRKEGDLNPHAPCGAHLFSRQSQYQFWHPSVQGGGTSGTRTRTGARAPCSVSNRGPYHSGHRSMKMAEPGPRTGSAPRQMARREGLEPSGAGFGDRPVPCTLREVVRSPGLEPGHPKARVSQTRLSTDFQHERVNGVPRGDRTLTLADRLLKPACLPGSTRGT